jgi:hypothetical protein
MNQARHALAAYFPAWPDGRPLALLAVVAALATGCAGDGPVVMKRSPETAAADAAARQRLLPGSETTTAGL